MRDDHTASETLINRTILSAIALSLSASFACSPAPSDPPTMAIQEPGAHLARRLCSECHAVGVNDFSQHPDAPPFRTLGEAYPVAYLEEALAEGIMVGHPDMPVFELSPEQVDAFLMYLEQLQPRSD